MNSIPNMGLYHWSYGHVCHLTVLLGSPRLLSLVARHHQLIGDGINHPVGDGGFLSPEPPVVLALVRALAGVVSNLEHRTRSVVAMGALNQQELGTSYWSIWDTGIIVIIFFNMYIYIM